MSTYLDEARSLMGMFGDDVEEEVDQVEQEENNNSTEPDMVTSSTFEKEAGLKEQATKLKDKAVSSFTDLKQDPQTYEWKREPNKASKVTGGLIAGGAALKLIDNYLKKKKGKGIIGSLVSSSENVDALKGKSKNELFDRAKLHGIDYLTNSFPKDALKAGGGLALLSAATLVASGAKGVRKGLGNIGYSAMLNKLKQDDELKDINFQDKRVKGLLKDIKQSFPKVAKNYYLMLDILRQYDEFGPRALNHTFYKSLADVEQRLGGTPSHEYISKGMSALPSGTTKSKFKSPTDKFKDIMGALPKVKLASEEDLKKDAFYEVKDYFNKMLKIAYLNDRVQAAVDLYKNDPVFNEYVNKVTPDFEKKANDTLTQLNENYEKLANTSNYFNKVKNHLGGNLNAMKSKIADGANHVKNTGTLAGLKAKYKTKNIMGNVKNEAKGMVDYAKKNPLKTGAGAFALYKGIKGLMGTKKKVDQAADQATRTGKNVNLAMNNPFKTLRGKLNTVSGYAR